MGGALGVWVQPMIGYPSLEKVLASFPRQTGEVLEHLGRTLLGEILPPAGLYLTYFARLMYEDRDSWDRADLLVSTGPAIGWSWVFGPFTARVGGGVQFLIEVSKHSTSGSWVDFDLPPAFPYIEGAFGIAF